MKGIVLGKMQLLLYLINLWEIAGLPDSFQYFGGLCSQSTEQKNETDGSKQFLSVYQDSSEVMAINRILLNFSTDSCGIETTGEKNPILAPNSCLLRIKSSVQF